MLLHGMGCWNRFGHDCIGTSALKHQACIWRHVDPTITWWGQVEENAKAVCKGEGQENAYGPLKDEEVNVSLINASPHV